MQDPVLHCRHIVKGYSQGPQRVEILRGLDLSLAAKQHMAIVGASGSGKSTLLNVLGGLDRPDAGEVRVQGQPFSTLSENARGRIRNGALGFVYQFHHLLGEFTAAENVAMPLWIGGTPKRQALAKATQLLEQVGLRDRAQHKPPQLSGGERQRVAIARAIANDPACVLMDEPTGNLDSGNAKSVQQLMQQLSRTIDTAFVVVTHDLAFAKTMDVVYELRDGVLVPLDVSL